MSTGIMLDFRDGGNYKFITAYYHTGDTTNGWYYGQSSGVTDFSVVAGESQSEFYIRLWLLEGAQCRLYVGGGTADKTGVFEQTALNTTLKFGGTASASLDGEIAHIGIYSLPDGQTFSAAFLDGIGEAIETYYAGGASPEATWAAITV